MSIISSVLRFFSRFFSRSIDAIKYLWSLFAFFFAFLLSVMTISDPEWIESVSGYDPDHGNGLLEVIILAVLIACCIGFGALGYRKLASSCPSSNDEVSRGWH